MFKLHSDYKPTGDQPKAIEYLSNGIKNGKKFQTLLGVTGSGKTEVYMELIEDALKKGKTSIVLVPEISLTPQMVLRFQKRFGDNIAAIHSAFSVLLETGMIY